VRHPVPCGPYVLGDGALFAIAGPDVLESADLALRTARELRSVAERLGLPLEIITPPGHIYVRYRDGLKIYTTIDSRMQRYAEQAMEEHMRDVQQKFFKECKQKKNAPFDWRVTKEEINSIIKEYNLA